MSFVAQEVERTCHLARRASLPHQALHLGSSRSGAARRVRELRAGARAKRLRRGDAKAAQQRRSRDGRQRGLQASQRAFALPARIMKVIKAIYIRFRDYL